MINTRKKEILALIIFALVLFFSPSRGEAQTPPDIIPVPTQSKCQKLNPSYTSMICNSNLCGRPETLKVVCPCDTSYCCFDPKKNTPVCSSQPPSEIQKIGTIKLQQPLEGFEGTKEVTGTTIGEYISAFYRYFAGAAAILATVMLLFSGFQWVTASGNASRIEKAKATMNGALIGLVLTLTAYVLLYTINPSLVKWSTLSLGIIPRETLETEKLTTGACPSDSELAKIGDFISNEYVETLWICKDPRVYNTVIPKLEAAAKELQKYSMKMVITSAHRSLDTQQKLYDCYVNNKDKPCPEKCVEIGGCNPAAKPSCQSPHVSGLALDICYIEGGVKSSCTKLSTGYNAKEGSPDYAPQTTLQKVMQKAGFSRYCGEWWHFESQPLSISCPPGDYTLPSQ